MIDVSFATSADGTLIAYRRVGAGPPVIVIHGGMGSSVGWGAVAARLSREFAVFLFDRRGRGLSDDARRPHSLQREVEDVEAVMELAGPQAALVGHSFGGAVALETARRAAPGRIRSLAVYEPAIGARGAVAATEIERMQALIAAGDSDAALDIAIAALDAAGLVSADPRPPGARRPDAALALAPTVPRELRAVTAPGLPVERYATLAIPTLVLAGTRSPSVQRENGQRLAAAVPGARLSWLEGLGHVAHTAAPDVVAAALTGFLRHTRDPEFHKG